MAIYYARGATKCGRVAICAQLFRTSSEVNRDAQLLNVVVLIGFSSNSFLKLVTTRIAAYYE